MMKKYDVLIVGGGTSGCACAYIAGKLGLKVLLIESNSYLGGSMTSSLVIPAMKTSDNAINTEFFNALYKELEKEGGAITYSDGNKGWFNPELLKIILDKMMKDVNVDVLFETNIIKINKKLLSYTVTICNNNLSTWKSELSSCIDSINIVDATGDAKIFQNFENIFSDKNFKIEFLENENKTQPVNLRFIMSGVNSKEFSDWLLKFDNNRDVSTACTIDGYAYFSTAYTWDTNTNWALKPLFKQGIEEGVITEEDSNYFQIFSIAGTPDSVGFNCPRILNSNISRTEAYIKGRESILRLSKFCKKYLKGFKNAYISNIANTLGVRVSNRVKCKYVYTSEDLKSGKKFDNPVLVSNYPIDVHSNAKNNSKLEKVYQEYQLPLESLIVSDNLFVIGRSISADFEAQAALRIIPSCFSMGEGLARYLAKTK